MAATFQSTSPTALLELCEPLFQYLCRLNRLGRIVSASSGSGNTLFLAKKAAGPSATGAALNLNLTYASIRGELVALLQDMQRKTKDDYRLQEQFKKLELPLKFFIDSYIVESKLPLAAQWNDNRLAYEHNELAGDEKFLEIVEETLRDKSQEATERLAVYYVCFGLGFTGAFGSQIELFRKIMNDIAPRIEGLIDANLLSRFCEDAYKNVDTTNLIKPDKNRLAIVGIVFACFAVAAIVAFVMIYSEASNVLGTALDEVKRHDPQTVNQSN